MLEQMKGNYLFPEEIEGKELFTAVKKEQMFQLAVKEQASFGIEMDMEQDTVSFHFREGEEELQEFCDIGFQFQMMPVLSLQVETSALF